SPAARRRYTKVSRCTSRHCRRLYADANFGLWQKGNSARLKRRSTKVGIDMHAFSLPNSLGAILMRSAIKIYILAIIANLAVTPSGAEDWITPVQPLPLPPSSFYVHAGANGTFPQTNAQPEGGGLFQAATIAV